MLRVRGWTTDYSTVLVWCRRCERMRCRRMQGADRARTHRQVGLRADALEASEIDMCCRTGVTPLIRCAALCYGITTACFSSSICGLRYYSTWGTRHNQPHMHCRRKLPRQAKHRHVSLAWCRPTPLRCHAISCHVPGGLRDLTERSASDAHINMTYVPYLHPAAVGPFRFAGYRILHLHLHGSVRYVCMW